ncbi:MAG: hypothetical protein ABI295_11445 [Xanthomarina sp.]
MKIIILAVVCLFILLFITTGCTRLVGGISKTKASHNLERYLQREYQGEVAFRALNRFFNASNMDPNMFSVVIYNKMKPEIEFICFLNAKNILVNDTLILNGLDRVPFNHLYKKAIKSYEARQEIRSHFINEISEINFNTATIDLKIDHNINAEDLVALTARLINSMNRCYEELEIYFEIALHIITPEHPEGFIKIPLEVREYQWYPESFLLSENARGFQAIKTRIETHIQTDLLQSHPDFEIFNYRKIFIDQSSLSKIAWVQYIRDKNINNDGHGEWESPLKGIYISYIDLQSGKLYKGEMMPRINPNMPYNEELKEIKKLLEAEGITAE